MESHTEEHIIIFEEENVWKKTTLEQGGKIAASFHATFSRNMPVWQSKVSSVGFFIKCRVFIILRLNSWRSRNWLKWISQQDLRKSSQLIVLRYWSIDTFLILLTVFAFIAANRWFKPVVWPFTTGLVLTS